MNLSTDLITLIVGVSLTVAAVMVGFREILLRPENDRYPKAPQWLRAVLFGYVMLLMMVGVSALLDVESGRTFAARGSVLAVLSVGIALHHSATTIWFLTQRHPRPFRAQVHDFALAHFHHKAAARRRPF